MRRYACSAWSCMGASPDRLDLILVCFGGTDWGEVVGNTLRRSNTGLPFSSTPSSAVPGRGGQGNFSFSTRAWVGWYVTGEQVTGPSTISLNSVAAATICGTRLAPISFELPRTDDCAWHTSPMVFSHFILADHIAGDGALL